MSTLATGMNGMTMRCVFIAGLTALNGGIGRTTLGKVVHRAKSSHFVSATTTTAKFGDEVES